MPNLRELASLGLILAVLGCQASRQETGADAERPNEPRAFLEDVDSRLMTSAISGRDYMISVALPLGFHDSTKTYPVLYALDANGQFGTVVETARLLRLGGEIPQLLIVGIGYPYGGTMYNAEPHRIIDFFPTLVDEWIEAMIPRWPEPIPSYESGGAAEFLRFLREELIPLIDADYRADTSDRAIYGHSGGGWFGLYSLLEGEGTFGGAIVGSPSLWWDDRLMLGLEESYAERNRSLPARVFLSVGSEESLETPWPGTDCFCMVSNLQRLVETLEARKYEGLEWRHHVFEDESHVSVVPATISRGLRYIYGRVE